jgi:hypothetical protein
LPGGINNEAKFATLTIRALLQSKQLRSASGAQCARIITAQPEGRLTVRFFTG